MILGSSLAKTPSPRYYASRTLVYALCSIGLSLVTPLLGQTAGHEAEQYAKIREGLKKLLPLVGKWDVAVTFHDPDRTLTEEVGTWNVSSVVDDTYLEFQTERHLKDNPKRHRLVLFYVTFNPKSNKYDVTFFYNWSAMRVTLSGEFNDATHELRTRGYIPQEDGTNDETVAEMYYLKDPQRIVYKHYSMRSPSKTAQRLDVEMILTRAK
ncbi:MAG: DUF1579 family protein [Candidatus Udaeobacter sp.]